MTPFAQLEEFAKRASVKRDEDAVKKKRALLDKRYLQARRRLRLRTAVAAIKGGGLGALAGGLIAASQQPHDPEAVSPVKGALIGGGLGAAAGGGYGYISGKLRQAFGYDPMLDTVAVTGST